MNARQLCRWAAMQHPDAEIGADEGLVIRLTAWPPGTRRPNTEVRVEGPTASAFEENGEKEKTA